MKLQILGANRARVTLGDGTEVFFSYSTAVASRAPDGAWARTDVNHSRTTAKHIGQFGCPKDAPRKPQAFFDNLKA